MSTVTDQYGQYQFDSDLPKFEEIRSVTLRAVADGFAVAQCSYQKPTIVRATNYFPKLLPTKPNRLVTNLSLPRRSQKVLTVVDPSNKPLAGAKLISLNELSCFSDTRVILGENIWNALGLEIATSSEQGEFRDLPICDERTYTAVVSHPDFALGETTLQPNQPRVVQLSKGTLVTVVIKCDHDQTMVKESHIHVIYDSNSLSFLPDENGRLLLRLTNDGLSSGHSIYVNVDHPSLTPTRGLTFTPNNSEMNFSLCRTGRLKGRLIDSNGLGVVGSMVSPLFASKSPVRHGRESAVTDTNGEYQLKVIEGNEIVGLKMGSTESWADKQLDFQPTLVEANKDYSLPDVIASLVKEPFWVKVVDSKSGQPVSGMVVVPRIGKPKLTDESGMVSFMTSTTDIATQAVDPFRAFSAHQMVKLRYAPVNKDPGRGKMLVQIPEEMCLQPDHFLRVQVMDERELTAIPFLSLRLEQGNLVNLKATDRRGMAVFEGLAEGECKLKILGRDWRDKPVFEQVIAIQNQLESAKIKVPLAGLPKNLGIHPAMEDKPTKPLITDCDWLAGHDTTLDCEPTEHLVVCISPYLDVFTDAALVHSLYAGKGFKFVGVWRCMNSEELSAARERGAFPILIDDARSRIAERFGVPIRGIEWPYFIIYDSHGYETASGVGIGNLIGAVRHEYLSQQQ
ncbi:MAG: carboxypeptidase-like regulatory domain-containing protein [Pirellulales bacterium]